MTPNTELSDEQIVAAFLMRRPDWRLEGDWLIVGGGPAREVGDAIHKSDVIDAARAALSAVSRSEGGEAPRMLTEDELLSAIQSCGRETHGRIALTFESGPYDIDRPTLVADKLALAIQRKFMEVNGIAAGSGSGGVKGEAWDREDVEAVAACLGDDAAQLRDDNDEDERADNMDRAASMLTWMLMTHPALSPTSPPNGKTADVVGAIPVCSHGIHMDNACGACVPPRGTTVSAVDASRGGER